ncbi:MAG: cupin domain-containing protein [Deltaproteobacteria bacterium]|nr:cupin domain-containing protein [Deltaproteobacteria bacterium]
MKKKHKKIIQELKLEPHPEGGWFSETYRSDLILSKAALSESHSGARPASTAIYFLLTKDHPISRLHQLKSDEMFHFYDGDPLQVLLLRPNGTGSIEIVGKDIENGERPQLLIPKGTWFGAKLNNKASYVLMGCTVAPGFDFEDFTMDVSESDKKGLLEQYPDFSQMIEELISQT